MNAVDPRLLAADYARAGLRVFPVHAATKDPLPGYLWKARASSNVSTAVQDADEAAARWGDGGVSIAWALGLDGYCALDLDHDRPDWWDALAEHAAVNRTRRGHHLVFRNPEGVRPGNSTGRFPSTGWGEMRGFGGYIVIAGPDRPGFDVADLDRAEPFPHPEWLTETGDATTAATDAEVAAFVDRYTLNGDTAALGAVARYLDGWTPGGRTPSGEATYKAARHVTAVDVACWVAELAARGELSAVDGFGLLDDWWRTHMDDRRRRDGNELASIKRWAVGRVQPADPARVSASVEEPGPAGALDHAHAVARRWLGAEYDLDALDATLAAAAVERLDGDPVWLLVIAGPGNAKTETVQTLAGAGATITSTISSPGALLSASPRKDRGKDSTGGLLRKLGSRGTLVLKDVTSILSMDRNARAEVLAALREVYDGRWERNVGTDGGRTLTWAGRLVVIGAVTTSWDQAHAVIAAMGDRFVLVRLDSRHGRLAAGRQSIRNTGHEAQMRADLADAAGAVIAAAATEVDGPDDDEAERLLAVADLVTLARTAVERDYRGDVIDAHAPESAARLAKQLVQLFRGGLAIGMDRPDALRLAIRCARDTMPPLRLALLDDLDAHPLSTTTAVRKRLDKPRATVDRELQALHALGLIIQHEDDGYAGHGTAWRYQLADDVNPAVLTLPTITRFVGNYTREHKKEGLAGALSPTNISGNGPNSAPPAGVDCPF